jgi:hypothetical protein
MNTLAFVERPDVLSPASPGSGAGDGEPAFERSPMLGPACLAFCLALALVAELFWLVLMLAGDEWHLRINDAGETETARLLLGGELAGGRGFGYVLEATWITFVFCWCLTFRRDPDRSTGRPNDYFWSAISALPGVYVLSASWHFHKWRQRSLLAVMPAWDRTPELPHILIVGWVAMHFRFTSYVYPSEAGYPVDTDAERWVIVASASIVMFSMIAIGILLVALQLLRTLLPLIKSDPRFRRGHAGPTASPD